MTKQLASCKRYQLEVAVMRVFDLVMPPEARALQLIVKFENFPDIYISPQTLFGGGITEEYGNNLSSIIYNTCHSAEFEMSEKKFQKLSLKGLGFIYFSKNSPERYHDSTLVKPSMPSCDDSQSLNWDIPIVIGDVSSPRHYGIFPLVNSCHEECGRIEMSARILFFSPSRTPPPHISQQLPREIPHCFLTKCSRSSTSLQPDPISDLEAISPLPLPDAKTMTKVVHDKKGLLHAIQNYILYQLRGICETIMAMLSLYRDRFLETKISQSTLKKTVKTLRVCVYALLHEGNICLCTLKDSKRSNYLNDNMIHSSKRDTQGPVSTTISTLSDISHSNPISFSGISLDLLTTNMPLIEGTAAHFLIHDLFYQVHPLALSFCYCLKFPDSLFTKNNSSSALLSCHQRVSKLSRRLILFSHHLNVFFNLALMTNTSLPPQKSPPLISPVSISVQKEVRSDSSIPVPTSSKVLSRQSSISSETSVSSHNILPKKKKSLSPSSTDSSLEISSSFSSFQTTSISDSTSISSSMSRKSTSDKASRKSSSSHITNHLFVSSSVSTASSNGIPSRPSHAKSPLLLAAFSNFRFPTDSLRVDSLNKDKENLSVTSLPKNSSFSSSSFSSILSSSLTTSNVSHSSDSSVVKSPILLSNSPEKFTSFPTLMEWSFFPSYHELHTASYCYYRSNMRQALVFSGQGVFRKGMGMEHVTECHSLSSRIFRCASDRLKQSYGVSLQDIILQNPSMVSLFGKTTKDLLRSHIQQPADHPESTLSNVRLANPQGVAFIAPLAQSAIVSTHLVLYGAWVERHLSIAAREDIFLNNHYLKPYPSSIYCLTGHSLGEFSALCIAGLFPVDVVVDLVFQRGLLMEEAMECVPTSSSDRFLYACSPKRAKLGKDNNLSLSSSTLSTEIQSVKIFYEIVECIGKAFSSTTSFIEIVNINIREDQYVVAGDKWSLSVLGKCLDPHFRYTNCLDLSISDIVLCAFRSVVHDKEDDITMDPNAPLPPQTISSNYAHCRKSSMMRRSALSGDDFHTSSPDQLSHLTLEDSGRSGLKAKSWFQPLPLNLPFHSSLLRRVMDQFYPLVYDSLPSDAHIQRCLFDEVTGKRWISNWTGCCVNPDSSNFIDACHKRIHCRNIGEQQHHGKYVSTKVFSALTESFRDGSKRKLCASLLAAQLAYSVQWEKVMDEIVLNCNCSHIVEISPIPVLSKMFQRTIFRKDSELGSSENGTIIKPNVQCAFSGHTLS